MDGIDLFSIALMGIFIIGYICIAFEHLLDINKATSALMMGFLCWMVQFFNSHVEGDNLSHLYHHLSSISQVIIFLLSAMIIVEIIAAHQGFKIITNNLFMSSKKKFLWIIGLLTFFLSSVLDNLTTTIVMVSIIQKMVADPQDRMLIGGGIVIAANAGGAWTPIGDVTTTMLWIGGQVSTGSVMAQLFAPSFICYVVSFLCLSPMLKGKLTAKEPTQDERNQEPMGLFFFCLGLGVLVSVPIIKLLTGLPPFMGIIFGLSIMWLLTDVAHRNKSHRNHLRVTSILSKVDLSGPLFFLGILLAINALETAGLLEKLSEFINHHISSPSLIAAFIGIASSIVDNIPLVAATMGMYDLSLYPIDSSLWQLIAYCAGTGGSILIIGSAAGVVYMGMEKVDFFFIYEKNYCSCACWIFCRNYCVFIDLRRHPREKDETLLGFHSAKHCDH